MARLKNVTSDTVLLESTEVKPGEVVEVHGEVARRFSGGFVVGTGNAARAYSTRAWQVDEQKPGKGKSKSSDSGAASGDGEGAD